MTSHPLPPSTECGISKDDVDYLTDLTATSASASNRDLPVDTRQILLVTKHSVITSNSVDSTASGITQSATVVKLAGVHSPSSDPTLTTAYITFVEDSAKVPVPRFIKKKKGSEIRLWMHHRNLAALLFQLHEPNVYCWIGHFKGGHIYGDVHTGH